MRRAVPCPPAHTRLSDTADLPTPDAVCRAEAWLRFAKRCLQQSWAVEAVPARSTATYPAAGGTVRLAQGCLPPVWPRRAPGVSGLYRNTTRGSEGGGELHLYLPCGGDAPAIGVLAAGGTLVCCLRGIFLARCGLRGACTRLNGRCRQRA